MAVVFTMQLKKHFLLLARGDGPLFEDREVKKGYHHGIRGCRNGEILKEREEISVNSLAEMLEIPKANTSQHLAVLRQAGVVNTRKDGINVYYSLKSEKISEACSLTRQILLERLEDHVSLSDLIRKTGD